jgi:DME family drug/metabolite transporter
VLPHLAVVLAAVCFGTTGTAQAFAPAGADPGSIGAARILIGGTLLALLALGLRMHARTRPESSVSGGPERAPGRLTRGALVVVGALGVLAYQPAFFAGVAENGVAVGTVVALGSAPVITGLLSWPITRRAPGSLWVVATLVALVGVVLISGVVDLGGSSAATVGAAGPIGDDGPIGADEGAPVSAVSLKGLLASVGAGASYAVYTLASKALLDRGLTPGGTMGAVFGLAALFSLPLLLRSDASWMLSPAGGALAAWLGVVTTTLAYVLFGWGLGRLPAATVATLTLTEPLTATLLGTLLLGEVLAPASVAGLGVLALGILLLTAGPAVRRGAGRPQERPRAASRT